MPVMVNFTCELDWVMGHLDIALRLISRYSCEVLPEERTFQLVA